MRTYREKVLGFRAGRVGQKVSQDQAPEDVVPMRVRLSMQGMHQVSNDARYLATLGLVLAQIS